MAVLQGPTGVGKSSLVMQWTIRLTLNQPFFGIKPVKPMRVLIIQAENDRGDMAEAFQDITNDIGLTNDEMSQIRNRLVIVNQDEKTGPEFAEYLEKKIARHKPDIVFVDPLLAYAGDDILQQKVMSKFLRNQINPILRRTGVLLIWIHHIGKPGGNANGQEKSSEQNKYSGLGSSELQNVCREVITLSHVELGTYSLEFTKRGGRLGLKDRTGRPIRKFNIEHSPNGIVWIESSGELATANKAGVKALVKIEIVYKKIVESETMTGPQLKTWAPTADIAVNSVLDYAKTLASDADREPRIYAYKDNSTGQGNKATVYSTTPPPN